MDDDFRCRFCKRYVMEGLYVRVGFPDGVANVCHDCYEERDEPDPDVVEWRGAEVEVS